MATLQELIDQYATELPDYLRVQPKESSRSPASYDPSFSAPYSREIRVTPERLKELQERETRYFGLAKKATTAEPLKLETPKTQEAYSEAARKLEELYSASKPEKQESNLLAEALITFLPALLGAGAGAAFGGPGGVGAGLAGGAQAGVGAIAKMKEDERKRQEMGQKAKLEYLDKAMALQLQQAKETGETERLPLKSDLLSKELQARGLFDLAGIAARQAGAAAASAKKTTETGTKPITGAAAKAPPPEAKVEFEKLPPPIKVQVNQIAKYKAQSASLYDVIAPQIEIMKNPKNSQAVRQSAGQFILTSLNAAQANTPNAVGEGEAARIGSLNETKFLNLFRPGSFIGSDVPEYISLVEQIHKGIGSRAGAYEKQIKSLYEQGGAKYYGAAPQAAAEPTLQSAYPKMSDKEKQEYQSATPERRKQIINEASKR